MTNTKLLLLWATALAFPVGCDSKVPQSLASTQPTEINILAWNIESGGSDTADVITHLNYLPSFEILALSEVAVKDIPLWKARYAKEQVIIGTKGGNDRLLIVVAHPIEVVRVIELLDWRGEEVAPGGHRAPLIVHVRDATGREFMVMNNHLARSNADLRTRQAEILVEWARDETLPVIAVGDYNMDYDFPTVKGNEAFAAMLRDGIYKWIRPKEFIDTNWADRNGDGIDDYPDSMLDFCFVSGPAMDWDVTSEVIVRDGDFPDDESTSDHRPVLTVIKPD